MGANPLRALSGPERDSREEGQERGPRDKETPSILILSGLVLLVAILLGLKTIASDLLH